MSGLHEEMEKLAEERRIASEKVTTARAQHLALTEKRAAAKEKALRRIERLAQMGMPPGVLGVENAGALADFWSHVDQNPAILATAVRIKLTEHDKESDVRKEVIERGFFGREKRRSVEIIETLPERFVRGFIIGKIGMNAVLGCEDRRVRLSGFDVKYESSDNRPPLHPVTKYDLASRFWTALPSVRLPDNDRFVPGNLRPMFKTEKSGDYVSGIDFTTSDPSYVTYLTGFEFLPSTSLPRRLAEILLN